MPLRIVLPHDLRGMCRLSGTTLEALSHVTGISEANLTSFARGTHGLSACDRFAIIVVLDVAATSTMPERTLDERLDAGRGYGRMLLTSEAFDELLAEMDEELRERSSQ